MSNAENVPPGEGGAGGGAGGARSLARELARLAAAPPPGVQVQINDHDLTQFIAIVDGPAGTPYAGGVFRVSVSLAGWPAAPRARFLTRVFHPNVSAAGDVCVSTLARDWRPELGLRHALLALTSLLIAPNPDSALNADAAALLAQRYDDYARRAKMLTEIHAQPHMLDGCGSGEAGGKRPAPPPPRANKDKRRILKRL